MSKRFVICSLDAVDEWEVRERPVFFCRVSGNRGLESIVRTRFDRVKAAGSKTRLDQKTSLAVLTRNDKGC